MKTLMAILTLFTWQTMAANYTDAAVELGFRQQNGTYDGEGIDEKAQTGFQVGVSGAFPIADKFSFRTGMFYVEKPLEADGGVKTKFTYFQVPVTGMFKFQEYAGVYFGVNAEVNLGSDCEPGSCDDVKSLTTPFVVGAAFKFASQLGANVFFESGSGEVADGVKDFRAVGANLMITFD